MSPVARDRMIRIKESALADLRQRAASAPPAGRPRLTEAQLDDIADAVLAKMNGNLPTPTAAELAKMDPADVHQHAVNHWSNHFGARN